MGIDLGYRPHNSNHASATVGEDNPLPVRIYDGAGNAGAKVPVTAAAGDLAALGALADAEVAGAGAASVIALLKRLRTLLNGGLPAALVSGRVDVNVGNTATANLALANTPTGDLIAVNASVL